MSTQNDKAKLSLAGEFGVASELSKRGMNINITFGNAKATDIIICNLDVTPRSYKTIEVKTSRSPRFVTGFFQKYGDPHFIHPDYWVIVYVDKDLVSHYYILTHEEMGHVQMERNGMTVWETVPDGCDNVLLSHIAQFENQWNKINV